MLGVPFNVTYSADSNHVTHLCTRPSFSTLVCTTRDKKRDWNLESQMLFSGNGFINMVTNKKLRVSEAVDRNFVL